MLGWAKPDRWGLGGESPNICTIQLKVFFSESEIRFINLQISKINYSKSLSWTWNLKFPPITVNNLFKFQAQDSDLEYFFWRFEKRITLTEKKTPLVLLGKKKNSFICFWEESLAWKKHYDFVWPLMW